MRVRESGCAAQLWTRPILAHLLLVFVIPLIREIFIRGCQSVHVMGLLLGYNVVKELQVNVGVAERYTLDVESSIWLKA